MKKIMKKAFSLMLTLVMVLALTPMTTKASLSMTGELDTTGSQNTVYYDGENNYEYTWTPEESGTYTFTFLETDWVCVVSHVDAETTNPIYDAEQHNYNNSTGSFTVDVTAGVEYTVAVGNTSWTANDEINFTVQAGGSSGSTVQGSGTENDPYIVTNTMNAEGLGYGSTAYYAIKVSNPMVSYTVTVVGSGKMDAFTVVSGTSEASAMGGSASVDVTPYLASSMVVFSVTNQCMTGGGTYTFTIAEATDDGGNDDGGNDDGGSTTADGSFEKPYDLQLDTLVTANVTSVSYYKYVATATGKLTVSMYPNLCSAGYEFSIYGGEYEAQGGNSTDAISSAVYYVKAGEEVLVWAATAEFSAGTVYFQASFEECEYPTTQEEVSDFVSGSENDEIGYIYATKPLVVGDNEVPVSSMYTYTIYEFVAPEAGVYEITITSTTGGVISYWGNNPDFVNKQGEGGSYVEAIATDANQPIMVGLADVEGSTCTLTVVKTGGYNGGSGNVESKDYENTKTPSDYTLAGNADDYEYVNIDDATVDKAVLGTDGYYHLNSADGPLLLVDLNDEWMNLYAAAFEGRLNENILEDGKVVEKINYSAALLAYYECADVKTGMYPMTADLKAILEKVGASMGWYESYGIIGAEVDTEDNWMFCTLYIPDVIEGADSKYVQGSKDGVTIRFNIPLAEFKELKVDGKVVDAKYYTKAEGSTIITLSAEYLDTLSAGDHAVVAVSTTGKTIETSISVATSTKPITADASAMVISLIVLAGAAFVTAGVVAKKRFA